MTDDNRQQPRSWRRNLVRGWRLWLLITVAAYALVGFFLAPWLIQRQLVSFGENRLQRSLTAERVRVNPFALSLGIEGLKLDEADGGPIASLGELYVNFQASSLFRWAWTFKELRLDAPYLNFIRYEDGRTNLGRLAKTLSATAEPDTSPPEPAGGQNEPLRLVLMHFLLEGGSADVTDRSRQTDFSTRFGPIRLELLSLSTLPEEEAGNSFRVVTESGAEIVWSGRLQANPFSLRGHLEARGERPRLIWRYIQDQVGFEIVDGHVSLSLDLDVTDDGGPLRVAVDNLSYTLDDLLLRPKGVEQDVLRVPKLAITGARLRLPERAFHVETARIEGARLTAFRDEQGVLNVLDLLKPSAPTARAGGDAESAPDGEPSDPADGPATTGSESAKSGSSSADAAAPAKPEPESGSADAPPAETEEPAGQAAAGADGQLAATAGAGPESAAGEVDSDGQQPWRFTLAKLGIEDFGARFEDRSWSQPVRTGLDKLNLTLTGFSTEPGNRFQVKLDSDITSGGRVTAEGTVGLEPQVAELAFDLQSLALDPLETMIADKVSLRLLSGALSINGKLGHGDDETLAFSGAASIDELVTEDTILDERFVAFKRLSMPSIEFALDAGTLAIETVDFDAPYGKLTIKADGTTNITDVFTGTDAPGGEPEPVASSPASDAADARPLDVAIRKVTIDEGSANFADLSLPLPFVTAIHSMKGEVGNIRSAGDGPATVDIAGVVDESGSADIAGELDPFAPTDHLQMDVVFKNVHMPRLTPYSAKFAGREIESGKLNLDLRYRIEEGQLDSTNSIVIDRIKLGRKVDSPEAVNLPLDLAIALLQDSNGQIDLDLPVSGDLNNPEFHYGPVVWKAFLGILVKAVTAPFKLLGALIPGGGKAEQLEFIEFDPGSATLSATETADLDTIAQAIAKRPKLLLKVPSAYSATTDKQAIQARKVRDKVGQRLPQIEPREGITPERIALEDVYMVEFSRTELDNLRAANTRASDQSGGKPTLDEEAYLGAITRSLRENETVETTELESLARARGKAITEYLVNTGGVPAGQLGESDVTTVEPTADGMVQLRFEVGSGAAPPPAATSDSTLSGSPTTG